MLLYCLLPSHHDEKKCSACSNHAGSGPFAECVVGGEWTDGACLNCWFTGAMHRCSLRQGKHCLCPTSSNVLTGVEFREAQEEATRLAQRAPGTLPEGAERAAHPDDLDKWRDWIRAELAEREARRREDELLDEGR